MKQTPRRRDGYFGKFLKAREVLIFLYFEVFKFRNFEVLKFWRFEVFKFGNFEVLNFWSIFSNSYSKDLWHKCLSSTSVIVAVHVCLYFLPIFVYQLFSLFMFGCICPFNLKFNSKFKPRAEMDSNAWG